MTAILTVLGVMIYLIIGGVVDAIVDDEEMFGLIIFWPVFVGFVLVVAIGVGFKNLGLLIVTAIKDYLNGPSSGKE